MDQIVRIIDQIIDGSICTDQLTAMRDLLTAGIDLSAMLG